MQLLLRITLRCDQVAVAASRDMAPEVPPAAPPAVAPVLVQPSMTWLQRNGDDVFGVVAAAFLVVLANHMVRSGYWTAMPRFPDW